MWRRIRNLLAGNEQPATEVEDALQSATSDLEQAISQDREIRQVAAELRFQRERNHFAERIKATMRGA